MAGRRDKRRKRHYESTRTDRSLKLHAQESGKDYKHHHASACADKTSAKADGNAAKDGDYYSLEPKLLALLSLVLAACIGLNKEAYSYAECQEQCKASEHDITYKKSDIASDCTHGQDANHHEPSALEIDILVFAVCVCGNRRAQNI